MRDTVLTAAEAQVLRLFVLPSETSENAESWDAAGLRASDRAAQVIAEAGREALAIRRQIEEGARASGERSTSAEVVCFHPAPASAERLEAARVLAAAGTPLARPALVRAAARDPDAQVRAAARGAVALDAK